MSHWKFATGVDSLTEIAFHFVGYRQFFNAHTHWFIIGLQVSIQLLFKNTLINCSYQFSSYLEKSLTYETKFSQDTRYVIYFGIDFSNHVLHFIRRRCKGKCWRSRWNRINSWFLCCWFFSCWGFFQRRRINISFLKLHAITITLVI